MEVRHGSWKTRHARKVITIGLGTVTFNPDTGMNARALLVDDELGDDTTLWQTNIAVENTPFIVDFPIKNGEFP